MEFRNRPEDDHRGEPIDRPPPCEATTEGIPFHIDTPIIPPAEDDVLDKNSKVPPAPEPTILPHDPVTDLQEDPPREFSRPTILKEIRGVCFDNSVTETRSPIERDEIDEALDVTRHLGVVFELATLTIGPATISAAVGCLLDHLDGRGNDAKTSWDIGEGGFSLATGIRVILEPTSAFALVDGLRTAGSYAQLVQGLDDHLGQASNRERIDPDATYTVERWILDQCPKHPHGINTCDYAPPRGPKALHPMLMVVEYGPRKKKRRTGGRAAG